MLLRHASPAVDRRVTPANWSAVGALRAAYGLLGAGIVLLWTAQLLRGPASYSTWLDGWLVVGIEVAASLLCLGRGVVRPQGRGAALALGFGLFAWAIGEGLLAVESFGGAVAPTPSAADAFYLCFYPMAYVAVVLFLRAELHREAGASWLDGAVAGLGAAAVCAAFAFEHVIAAPQAGALGTAVTMAYPIGDLILLALVVGGTAAIPGTRRAAWFLLAGGLAFIVLGDTMNLLQSSLFMSRTGAFLDTVAWPTATVLMSLAVWEPSPPRDLLTPERLASFALPGAAAMASLAIIVTGTFHPLPRAAVGLASATLAMVGVRLARSVRVLRALSLERQHLSVTDDLTGLGNRRYLHDLLEAYFKECATLGECRRDLAFLFLDLDHFKEINDSFGHSAGDELLRQLGPRFRSWLRDSDVLVRVGGDEFAVLLFGSDVVHATDVAARLAASLAQPFALNKVKARVGASIGIAVAPGDAEDADSLMWCADVAMYRAKVSDVDFAVYGLDLDGGNRLQMADELRAAIDDHQLVVHYQLQLDLRSGEVVAVEALVRWAHPELGILPPLQFLPLAHEAGLMVAVTQFVLEESLAQCARWRAEGRQLVVSINIAPPNLLEAGFVKTVADALDRHGVGADALVIEITEICVITDLAQSRVVIDQLRALGVVVSIDDFGAGATSLAYLGNLKVGELKLDRSFITELAHRDKAREIELVRATVDLGHALGLRVVAEGIEDFATLEVLTELGCDLAQGFYISHPMPAGQLDLAGLVAAGLASG